MDRVATSSAESAKTLQPASNPMFPPPLSVFTRYGPQVPVLSILAAVERQSK